MSETALFGVDVEAEIRALGALRFKADGEPIMALVRFAVDQGAGRIDLEIRRRAFEMRCRGAALSEPVASALIALFDGARTHEERHRALERLEQGGGADLLAAFAGAPRHVIVEWNGADFSRGIAFSARRPPRRYRPGEVGGLRIAVRRAAFDRDKTLGLIARHLRYCQSPITLNGRKVGGPLRVDGCLVQAEVRNPRMRGSVGLPIAEDLLRVQRLRSGILVEEIVQPPESGIALHAVVEEEDGDREETLATLKRAARRLYAKLAARHRELEEPMRRRAEDLLFERYRHTFERSLLEGVRAFSDLDGQAFDLFMLEDRARDGVLYAVDQEAPLSAYDCAGLEVLRLDRRQRRFLEEQPGIRLAAPPLRVRDRAVHLRPGARLRQVIASARQRFGRAPGERVPDEQLDTAERQFLDAVRAELASGDYLIGAERPAAELRLFLADRQRQPLVRVPGDPPAYAIARDHPEVAAAIRAFADDPCRLFPALALVTGGRGRYRAGADRGAQAIFRRFFAPPPKEVIL